jgi:RNA polymerase-binding transcription factor DksA
MSTEPNGPDSEKARLLEKRNELRERLEAVEKDFRRGLDADSGERAVQLENAEVLEGIARATAAELERIEKRLAELS